MALKLFLKHLFKSIKNRPIQPVLLVIVIMLAVSVCIASYDIKIYLNENENNLQAETFGTADYAVQINSLSETRFILAGKAREELPENVDICGLYALPMLFGEENDFVYGVATDYYAVNNIFSISLTDFATLTEKDIAESVFISSDFSEEHNISVGDRMELSVLGKKLSLTVFGISKKKFMATYDVLFDIRAVTDSLKKESLFLSCADKGFEPASCLYIRSNGMETEVEQRLHALYPDMSVVSTSSLEKDTLMGLTNVVNLMMIISVFFAIIVSYCCFHILSMQRKEETDLFYGVGAKKYMLLSLSAIELMIYWALGSLLGLFLSVGISRIFLRAGNLEYCTPMIHWQSVAISFISMLFASEVSLLITAVSDFIKQKKEQHKKVVFPTKQKKQGGNIFAMVLFLGGLIFLSVTVTLPITDRYLVGLFGFLCIVFFGFLFAKILIKRLNIVFAKKSIPVSFRYALKNAERTTMLGNTAGLISAFFAVFCSLLVLLSIATCSIENTENILSGDYIVLNANRDTVLLLDDVEGVTNLYPLFKENIDYRDRLITLLSYDDRNALSKNIAIEPNDKPQGNEAYCAEMYMINWGIDVGEEFFVTVGDKTLCLVYTKPIETVEELIIIDSDYWDIPKNFLMIEGDENYDSEQLYNNIMTRLTLESATVVPKEEFLDDWTQTIRAYLLCAELLVSFITVFALIGMVNNIVSSYRSRKEEFYYYHICGMSRSGVKKLKQTEVVLCVILGFLIFLLLSSAIFFALYEISISFKLNIIWIWKEFLG